jgi:subtilisin family serine protease
VGVKEMCNEGKNVVVISSVGNSNRETPEALYYPAAYPTVIGVGSVNKRGYRIFPKEMNL